MSYYDSLEFMALRDELNASIDLYAQPTVNSNTSKSTNGNISAAKSLTAKSPVSPALTSLENNTIEQSSFHFKIDNRVDTSVDKPFKVSKFSLKQQPSTTSPLKHSVQRKKHSRTPHNAETTTTDDGSFLKCASCFRVFRGPKAHTHKQQHIKRQHPEMYVKKKGQSKQTYGTKISLDV